MSFNPLDIINPKNKSADNYCSPRNKNNLGYSCFSKDDILELVSIFNNDFCDENQKFCYKHKTIKITSKSGKNRPIKNIYNDLKTKLVEFNEKNKNEYCWIRMNAFKKKFLYRDNLFVPEMPDEWCDKIREWRISRIEAPWLSNFDIDNIVEQYEDKYKQFKFLGSVPIDFRKVKYNTCILNLFMDDEDKSKWLQYKNSSNYCDFNISNYKNKHIFGIVFNTDTHDSGGKHWMSMYINLKKNLILFFDSAVTYGHLHPEINLFVENIKKKYNKKKFTFKYNTIQHQRSNSECGMYSIYFILAMLDADQSNFTNASEAFDNYFNSSGKTVTDKLMVLYRTKLFRSPCDC
tara:strand:- start:5574 stop:6617 length:1044 start_codon:yes stop_codon:yes gene_type:complete